MPEETLEPVLYQLECLLVRVDLLGGLPRDRATFVADLTINVDAWLEVDCLEVSIQRTLAAVLKSFVRSLSTLGCLSESLLSFRSSLQAESHLAIL